MIYRSIIATVVFLLLTLHHSVYANNEQPDIEPVSAIQVFQDNSLQLIETRYAGKPFLLVLWSLECPPCFKELKMLGQWKKLNTDFPIVLVSVDGIEQINEVVKVLNDNELTSQDSWIFGTTAAIKLRYSIDAQWYGELPRSYFYQANEARSAVSGLLDKSYLEQWLALAPAR